MKQELDKIEAKAMGFQSLKKPSSFKSVIQKGEDSLILSTWERQMLRIFTTTLNMEIQISFREQCVI